MKKRMAILFTVFVLGSFAACGTQEALTSADTAGTVSVREVNDTDNANNAQSLASADAESEDSAESSAESAAASVAAEGSSDTAVYTANTSGKLDTAEFFSERDLAQTADTSAAVTITAQDNKTETVTEEGVYILTGTASNFTVRVEADDQAKIQLVLDGLEVTNSESPVIYVVSSDKCFVTTTDSESTLSVTGAFQADGDTNTDAVIYSKDDIVFNGTGKLNISSAAGNGISGKDDIKFTGGSYSIQSAEDAIEANDSIVIYNGSFDISSSKDGLHSENSDDDTTGYIYIQNGSFNITASGDAIQATTVCQIDGGDYTMAASEGIEATYIQINDGSISISSSDDGINGSQKSGSIGTPTVEITGGSLSVTMGSGDVDCIDCNGNLIISGGTIELNYPAQGTAGSFDYDGTAEYTGGTIIINGTQVDSIPQPSMMGGGMGGNGGMMRGGFGRM